jgi:hypothetical protein
VQDALKAHERRLRDWEEADLEFVLRTKEGRRFYYRLIFELGNLNGPSWEPSIKDGNAAGQHTAHNEGLRTMARILADEAQGLFPDLWVLMLQERFSRHQAEIEERAKAITSAKEMENDN